jgi:hypothetical protein
MNPGLRRVLLITFLLSFGVLTNAQTFEVPNIEYPNDLCELRDQNRVFVHAPLNTRQQIVKELGKHSSLSIVERPEEADFLLLFTYSPFIDGSAEGTPSDLNAARAELAVVKFVSQAEGQVRPRILFFWSAQKSFHSVSVPFTGLSPTGISKPHSGKSAAGELILRLTLWAVHKKWPTKFYFDQFTNQLTVAMGGKLEEKGARAFLKALKHARSDDYARRCSAPITLPTFGNAVPLETSRLTRAVESVKPANPLLATLQATTPVQSSQSNSEVRPRSVKRHHKRRRTANKRKTRANVGFSMYAYCTRFRVRPWDHETCNLTVRLLRCHVYQFTPVTASFRLRLTQFSPQS